MDRLFSKNRPCVFFWNLFSGSVRPRRGCWPVSTHAQVWNRANQYLRFYWCNRLWSVQTGSIFFWFGWFENARKAVVFVLRTRKEIADLLDSGKDESKLLIRARRLWTCLTCFWMQDNDIQGILHTLFFVYFTGIFSGRQNDVHNLGLISKLESSLLVSWMSCMLTKGSKCQVSRFCVTTSSWLSRIDSSVGFSSFIDGLLALVGESIETIVDSESRVVLLFGARRSRKIVKKMISERTYRQMPIPSIISPKRKIYSSEKVMISLFFLKIEIIEETLVSKSRKLLTNVPRPEPVNSRHSKQDITEH